MGIIKPQEYFALGHPVDREKLGQGHVVPALGTTKKASLRPQSTLGRKSTDYPASGFEMRSGKYMDTLAHQQPVHKPPEGEMSSSVGVGVILSSSHDLAIVRSQSLAQRQYSWEKENKKISTWMFSVSQASCGVCGYYFRDEGIATSVIQ